MKILTLKTGLFEDAEIVIKAANAPVIDLKTLQTDEDWDSLLDDILDAELIVTA
jgi:hypothetical protein